MCLPHPRFLCKPRSVLVMELYSGSDKSRTLFWSDWALFEISLQIPYLYHNSGSLLCPPVSSIQPWAYLGVHFLLGLDYASSGSLGPLEPEMESHVLFLKLHQVWFYNLCPRDLMFSTMLCRNAFAPAQEGIRILVTEIKYNLEGRHIASYF